MTARAWILELRAPTPMRSTNAFRRMHWQPIARERRTWWVAIVQPRQTDTHGINYWDMPNVPLEANR